MKQALETEQMEILYDCADRCQRCQEVSCKQPVYVEVVYCPRFVAIKSQQDFTSRTANATPIKKASFEA